MLAEGDIRIDPYLLQNRNISA